MIFERALRRELVSTAGAVFTTLFTITLTVMLIKILGQAAGGQVSSQDVVALIGFQSLNYLPIHFDFDRLHFGVAGSHAQLSGLGMVVWFSAGLSLTRWVKPVLLFGWPIVLLTGVLSLLPHRGPMSKARSSANGSRNGKTLPAYHREISGIGHCQSHFLCRRRVR